VISGLGPDLFGFGLMAQIFGLGLVPCGLFDVAEYALLHGTLQGARPPSVVSERNQHSGGEARAEAQSPKG